MKAFEGFKFFFRKNMIRKIWLKSAQHLDVGYVDKNRLIVNTQTDKLQTN
jgi:hypothetical protein